MALMVAYGHSWVDGDGASSVETSFATLAARQLGILLDNRAAGGSASVSTAELLATEPPPVAECYLLMTGLNDLRLGGDSAPSARRYEESLHSILATLGRTSPSAPVIAVAQPHLLDFSRHAPHHRGSNTLIDQYNLILDRVAAGHSRATVAVADRWVPTLMLDADTVHPNDAGHACLAETVAATARAVPASSPDLQR
ncbi:SGNH/GDSL hydrolase family protein [Arthrobacter sp. 260]|uniref:SGNH/GDSL hydrolase family protein n=1 Tax=Arthrobacter sp. 260 TaxID=2735314 RepID=UPI0014927310|nr:SGNH/GDSL hydrolase family protein [Arthrobacter sp. 260]NOJ58905.1 SGNH/GDSL hydrolase family protein [Arthrobacter sp. 260]